MMNKENKTKLFRVLLSATMVLPFVGAFLLMQTVNASTSDNAKESITTPDVVAQSQQTTDDVIFTVVEDQPEYPGGETARMAYMRDNLRYPEGAREKGIQGTVFVTFVVRKDGSITDVRILRGIGGGCDEEAMRVVSNMPKWKAGRQRGQNVDVQYNLPVRFVLNTEKTEDQHVFEPVTRPSSSTSENIVLVIDGKITVVTDQIDVNTLVRLEDIKQMDVLVGEEARKRYGHDKVIVITRK